MPQAIEYSTHSSRFPATGVRDRPPLHASGLQQQGGLVASRLTTAGRSGIPRRFPGPSRGSPAGLRPPHRPAGTVRTPGPWAEAVAATKNAVTRSNAQAPEDEAQSGPKRRGSSSSYDRPTGLLIRHLSLRRNREGPHRTRRTTSPLWLASTGRDEIFLTMPRKNFIQGNAHSASQ